MVWHYGGSERVEKYAFPRATTLWRAAQPTTGRMVSRGICGIAMPLSPAFMIALQASLSSVLVYLVEGVEHECEQTQVRRRWSPWMYRRLGATVQTSRTSGPKAR